MCPRSKYDSSSQSFVVALVHGELCLLGLGAAHFQHDDAPPEGCSSQGPCIGKVSPVCKLELRGVLHRDPITAKRPSIQEWSVTSLGLKASASLTADDRLPQRTKPAQLMEPGSQVGSSVKLCGHVLHHDTPTWDFEDVDDMSVTTGSKDEWPDAGLTPLAGQLGLRRK